MQIAIEYWNMWNYKPEAVRVAAELEKAFGVTSELIAGSGGVFTVTVDGNVVYSKAETGRFPEPGETTKAVQPG